jgi:hypothetical protein
MKKQTAGKQLQLLLGQDASYHCQCRHGMAHDLVTFIQDAS